MEKSTVIIEALQQDFQPLSSDIPGCKEIFSDNNSEYIIKGFRKDSWCKKIIILKNDEIYNYHLLKDEEKRRAFSAKRSSKNHISICFLS